MKQRPIRFFFVFCFFFWTQSISAVVILWCHYVEELNEYVCISEHTANRISAGVRSICCSDNRLITNADAAFLILFFLLVLGFACALFLSHSFYIVWIFFRPISWHFIVVCFFAMLQHCFSQMLWSLLLFWVAHILSLHLSYVCDVVVIRRSLGHFCMLMCVFTIFMCVCELRTIYKPDYVGVLYIILMVHEPHRTRTISYIYWHYDKGFLSTKTHKIPCDQLMKLEKTKKIKANA